MSLVTSAAAGCALPFEQDDVFLAERAGAIRALGKRMVKDIIEIGRLLTECKDRLGHGNWLPWLDTEFGWSPLTAQRFMQVAALKESKFSNLENMTIDASALYLLAEPRTPNELRDEVIERAQNGEAITHDQVRELIDKARAETDAERAKERAAADAANASKLERLIAENRAAIEAREQAVRAEYDGKMVIEEGELTAQIELTVAPLIKKIEAQQKKLDAIHEREKARKKRNGDAPFINANVSLAATGVELALKHLVENLHRIEPQAVIEIEQKATTVTGQALQDRIGETVQHAKTALTWISEFITLVEGEAND